MSNLIESCKQYFNASTLYDVLGIEKGSSEEIVKKAYYKQSLQVHPDRVNPEEKENATEKFKTLGQVYSILSDTEKRKLYDETGSVDGEELLMDWEDYWRLLFKKVSKEDIIEFEKKYKGSEEERVDIKQLYNRFKGDKNKIMNSVLCATIDDEPRITEILQKMIDDGEVNSYKAFTSETKKKRDARNRKANREAQMAEKLAEEMGINKSLDGTEDGLRALILQRNKNREAASANFFSALEAKYGDTSSTKKRAKTNKKKQKSSEDEEEEEEAAAASSTKKKVNKKARLLDEEEDDVMENPPKKRKNVKMSKRK